MNTSRKYCVVPNCNSKYGQIGMKLSFHRVPVDKERSQLWIDLLNLQPHIPETRVFVCSLHFRPQDIFQKFVRPRWKFFLKPNTIPLKWADDPRNPNKCPKNEPETDLILDETEIKIEPEQISYTNTSEIFFLPKIESSTSTIKFVETQHVADKVKLENENGVVDNESMEKDNAVEQFVVAENEIVPGVSGILRELRSRNQQNMDLQNTIQTLRNKVKSLQQQVRRRDKKIHTLEATIKKIKAKKKTDIYPSSPQPVEFSTEELEEKEESEDSDQSLDTAIL